MPRFVDIVEDVTSLTIEGMEEIKRIIEKALIEKRREKIAKSCDESKNEHKKGQLKFYHNATDLMNSLDEPD